MSLLDREVATVVDRVGATWRDLAGTRLFVTGGTGLIGRWLLETLAVANQHHGLGVRVTVLSRDPAAFVAKAPALGADPTFRFVAGDVLDLAPSAEPYDLVIHAATDASADLNEHDPARMFDTVVSGTRRALDRAVAAGARRMLNLSSGAVYGAQPWEMAGVAEDWTGGPDCRVARNAYAEGKRAAEMLTAIYARQHGLDTVTARIFAVLGPLLPLDLHFAAGNFIRDALAGRVITINGAGTAVRSYLYLGDLVTWLWLTLLRAPPGAVYNMGSEEAVSIAELAARTAAVLGGPGHEVLGRVDTGWHPGRYVPATDLIRRELGVGATVGLDEAIRRTAAWNGWTA